VERNLSGEKIKIFSDPLFDDGSEKKNDTSFLMLNKNINTPMKRIDTIAQKVIIAIVIARI
jgi:hypothetical protein